MSRIVLVDGNALAARLYYAGGDVANAPDIVAPLTPEGSPCTVWCFDSTPPYWRHEIHPEYKATRRAKPHADAYYAGLEALKRRVASRARQLDGFEADDLLATFAFECDPEPVRIITTDKDMLQLCDPVRVEVYRPSALGWFADTPSEALGVAAVDVVTYLALIGDSSDNVPGIQGIGPVKARALIAEHRTLENILDAMHAPEWMRHAALMSRELVTLRTDAPVTWPS